MIESTYTAAVNELLPFYHLKLNLPYARGVADCWYSSRRDLWVEFKWYAKLPKRPFSLIDGKNPKLTRLQQDWLTQRHAEGRQVAVVVACPQGAVALLGDSWKYEVNPTLLTWPKRELAAWITWAVS